MVQLACPAPGGCLATGWESVGASRVLIYDQESAGTWGPPQDIPLPPDAGQSQDFYAEVAKPWCQSVGNCEIIGTYNSGTSLFSLTETAGSWASSVELA